MFLDLLQNIYYAKVAKPRGIKKLHILITLLKFSFKKKFIKSGRKEVGGKFFKYHVIGFDYDSLAFLYKELFCFGNYFFKSTTKNPVIIDCGANIGMSTMYFKNLFPDARIIAFEANPDTYGILKKNIENNNLSNVEVHNVALYDQEKEISFFTSSSNLRASIRKDRGGANELIIPAKKLSDYLKKIEKVDLIKIDVEGAELNIIQDLYDSSLLQKADQYIIEYHHNLSNENPSLSEFLAKFESQGFNYSIKANFYRIKGFQEILLYFYKK